MLTKVRVEDNIPDIPIVYPLYSVMKEHFIPHSTYFTNGNIVINDKSLYSFKFLGNKIILLNCIDRIPIDFIGINIWKKIESFDQNNTKYAKIIRGILASSMINNKTRNLYGIGGEYYGYFCILEKYYDNFYGLTNNKSIFEDAEFNMNMYLYNKNYKNKLVDYNKPINIRMDGNLIINLSIIHHNIINFIIANDFERIVIVSCKKKNTKKIKLLETKYKLYKKYILNDSILLTRYEIFIYDKN